MARDEELPGVRSGMQAHALGALFRALAERIEGDETFAQSLLAATEHGEIAPASGAVRTRRRTRGDAATPDTPDRQSGRPASPRPLGASHDASQAPDRLDPYAELREHGEAALRTRLGELDLTSLRAIVRTHRLDPARLSARWATRERLVELIVEQVRARARLGRAFEHV